VAPQGTSGLTVNVVGSILFVPGQTALVVDPASGAAAFQVTVTGNHHLTFRLEIANDAPVGTWAVTAATATASATGWLEITPRTVVTESITFEPAAVPRGATSPVALVAENVELLSTLTVSFPPESGVTVQGLQVLSVARATMDLVVAAGAPLGQVLATVGNGAHAHHPTVRVVGAEAGDPFRISEVMPVPVSLPGAYVELTNTHAQEQPAAGYRLQVQGGATFDLPDRVVAPGATLVLASADGVPGGGVVLSGLALAASVGLTLLDPQGLPVDTVNLPGVPAGTSLERQDLLASGTDPTNWSPCPALARAPTDADHWAMDRGTPGRRAYVELAGAGITGAGTLTRELGLVTTLVHHRLELAPHAFLAVTLNVDRVAGYAAGTFFAVDAATGLPWVPALFDAWTGDSLAVLETPATGAVADLRGWADPSYPFEPTRYQLDVLRPASLAVTPRALTLMPGESSTLAPRLLFDLRWRNASLEHPLPVDRATFSSNNHAVATVDDAGTVRAVATGQATVSVAVPFDLDPPAGPTEVLVVVGSSSPSAEDCDTALDVTAGGVWPDQSLVGARDDYDADGAGCPFARTAGDRVYVVQPVAGTSYRVTVQPAGSFDPALYVMSDCAQQTCVAGTVFNGPGQPEVVTFRAEAGQRRFIVVDGELYDVGNYSLTVTTE
jgi:hypothetical protein